MTTALRASELIEELQRQIARHGDLPVMDENDREVTGVEFNTDIGPVFLVVVL